jgi:hypothetical protein
VEPVKKRVAIMQPYFLPYVGYFQLISNVDEFVVYDDVKFTKKSWINRNIIDINGQRCMFTIPLKRASDFLNIKDRFIADTYSPASLFDLIKSGYIKSPYWSEVSPFLREILFNKEVNLFNFVLNSINCVNEKLGIKTKLTISSSLNLPEKVSGQERVIAICKELGAKVYVNAIGGKILYETEEFIKNDLELFFLNSNLSNYRKNPLSFIPALSILDLLFNADSLQQKIQINKDFKLLQ